MKGIVLTIGIALLVALELGMPAREPFDAPRTPTTVAPPGDCEGDTTSKRTKPADLLLLEGPDRASWQRPEQVMDELRIAEGSTVADIGAGSGWFTIRLAGRVGPNGLVYAQDVQPEMLTAIKRRVSRENLANVKTVLGDDTSPQLPARALDAILIVDVYAELNERVTFLRNLTKSLKPHGRIGVVNYKPGAGGPGPCADRRFPASVVEQDARAAELRVLSTMDLRYQYLVVLGR